MDDCGKLLQHNLLVTVTECGLTEGPLLTVVWKTCSLSFHLIPHLFHIPHVHSVCVFLLLCLRSCPSSWSPFSPCSCTLPPCTAPYSLSDTFPELSVRSWGPTVNSRIILSKSLLLVSAHCVILVCPSHPLSYKCLKA